jgi:hypothetical protein
LGNGQRETLETVRDDLLDVVSGDFPFHDYKMYVAKIRKAIGLIVELLKE